MAKQPQVVTAVIRPCNSPPAVKQPKPRPGPGPRAAAVKAKVTAGGAAPASPTAAKLDKPSAPPAPRFSRPTVATKAKSRSAISAPTPKNASKNTGQKKSIGRGAPKDRAARAPASQAAPKHSGPAAAAAPTRSATSSASATRAQRAVRPSSGSSGALSRRSGAAASCGGRGGRRSGSLSSRPAPTSSQGQRSSRLSPPSSRSRYPRTTSGTSAGSRPSGARTPSSASGGGGGQRAPATAVLPGRSPSEEARLNKLRNSLDHLRRTSPHIASPEFTSTRTNLASPGSSPRQPDSPGRHSGRSQALFHVQRRPRSRSGSRSRSATPVRDHSCTAGVTWVETHNRAARLPSAGADPGVAWQTRRDLPRVTYPSGVRSSPSQTRHQPVCGADEPASSRATLRSRGAQRQRQHPACNPATPRCSQETRPLARNASRTSPNADAGMATACPRPAARSSRAAGKSASCAAAVNHPAARSTSEGAQQRSDSPPRSIDYSPQSRYIGRLLRRGAVRRSQHHAADHAANTSLCGKPGNRRPGKENRPPFRGSGAGPRKENRPPCHGSGTGSRQTRGRSPPRDRPARRTVSTTSTASRRSVASEPATSSRGRKSILRASTATSSEPAPPHYGYDWISSMLDLSAPLPKTRSDVEAARRFREENFPDTHARHDWKDTAKRQAKNAQPDHKCVHEYYINQRLFPVLLYTDSQGRSQCPVCLAVAPEPVLAHRRSRSRSRSPVTGKARAVGRTRSRSPPVSRPGRPGGGPSRSVGRRAASPRRKQSSVSWHDEVVRNPPARGSQSSRDRSPSRSRSRSSTPSQRRSRSPPPSQRRSRSPPPSQRRSRSPPPCKRGSRSPPPCQRRSRSPTPSRRGSTERCIVCPNCRHQVAVLGDGSVVLSDSEASPPARLGGRTPPPPPVTPQRRRQTPAPATRGRGRSAVALHSRPHTSQQPVQAMFTVPTSLFGETAASSKSVALSHHSGPVSLAPAGYDWDAASFTDRDPLESEQWPGQAAERRRPRHPLWPRQLDSVAGMRPIARGWPQLEPRGDLARVSSRLANASRATGADPATRRSVQDSGAPRSATNTFSLRRVIGERI